MAALSRKKERKKIPRPTGRGIERETFFASRTAGRVSLIKKIKKIKK
jgi:hypothetical protein